MQSIRWSWCVTFFLVVSCGMIFLQIGHSEEPKDRSPRSPAEPGPGLLPSEDPKGNDAKPDAPKEIPANGITLNGFYAGTIVPLKDGSLITEMGMRSTDGGRTWAMSGKYTAPWNTTVMGIMRLPNGELGAFHQDGDDLPEACGNANNNWWFRWSSDEGKTWSEPVKISLEGLTMGLQGTMFALRDGKRICVVTYSQFLGSRFDKRGTSYGTLNGVRTATETEAHYPQAEVCRMYYSDDNGRTWKANDGWIMGWRENKYTDLVTEGDAVELKDGRIRMVARTVTGRLYEAFSDDRGHSWWPGARPMELASSYSPARIKRLPKTSDLLMVWNQVSREEIRKGLRRSRLSCAVSKDEGKTWGHFKNLAAIKSLADVSHVKPDDDLTPVWGDDEVGELPADFTFFHYPTISVVDNEVFVAWLGANGTKTTRILPVEWFYAQ